MIYISPQAKGFYLFREVMVELGLVSKHSPSIGDYVQVDNGSNASMHVDNANNKPITIDCPTTSDCPKQTEVPSLPRELPIPCVPENISKMEACLLQYFNSSTFNTCPHQSPPSMSGPHVTIYIDENAKPRAFHKTTPLPLHWQERAKADLLRDEALGVVETAPYGEPLLWCHRMVVTRKHDGTPCRTVDLSPLNKHCKRETFASESFFHIAKRVPGETCKTVCDAWNGYHSVPLRDEDKHLTTLTTPYGRYRYRGHSKSMSLA